MRDFHKPKRKKRMIYPVQNKKASLQKRQSTKRLMGSEVNTRAMMVDLYCGTSDADITKMGAFLGIPGTKS